MALVRVDFHESRAPDFQEKIGEIITQVMREVLKVPDAENYVIAEAHSHTAVCHQTGVLDDAQRTQIVFIQITLNQGRATELKQVFYAELKHRMQEQLGVPTSAIYINLVEVDQANWAFA